MIRAIRQVINLACAGLVAFVALADREALQALLAHVSPAVEQEFSAGFEPPEKAMKTA